MLVEEQVDLVTPLPKLVVLVVKVAVDAVEVIVKTQQQEQIILEEEVEVLLDLEWIITQEGLVVMVL
jgi:hypothetical protein